MLTVSNAALRFKPSGLKTDVAKPTKKREPGSATVYVLDDGKPRAVSITTGITDSRYTEVTGGDLKGGEVVITGESLAADSGANSGPRLRMF